MIRKINYAVQNNVNIESKVQKETNTQKTEKLSKADEIKKAIQNGTYKVDIQKIAKAMASKLLF